MVAFALDRAVWTFGRSVEQDMDKAEQALQPRGKKGKPAKPEAVARARQSVLDAYLHTDGKAREEATKGRFRDPALSVKRKG